MAPNIQWTAPSSGRPQGSSKTILVVVAVVGLLFVLPLVTCSACIVCSGGTSPSHRSRPVDRAASAKLTEEQRAAAERARREAEERQHQAKAAADAEAERFRALSPADHLAEATEALAEETIDRRLVAKHLDAVPADSEGAERAAELRVTLAEKALADRDVAMAERQLAVIPAASRAHRRVAGLRREIARVRREIVEEGAAAQLAEARRALERRDVAAAQRSLDAIPRATRAARQVSGLRRQVAALERELRNEALLAEVRAANASLGNDRASYQRARGRIRGAMDDCDRCPGLRQARAALETIERRIANWPIDIGSIREMQARYADLRNRYVRVRGDLSVTTYYNCAFRNQSNWRSFRFSDGRLSMGVHVYCYRGEAFCERLFERLAGGGRISGTATLIYPSHNSVCEEGQSEMVGFTTGR